MKMTMIRDENDGNSTIGKLYIDGEFECYTVEDEPRKEKLAAETRIAKGTYAIKPRTGTDMSGKYIVRHGGTDRGMLHLQEVPGFTSIYIHIGNTDLDSHGCILVGKYTPLKRNGRWFVSASTIAYDALYAKVIEAAEAGDLTIEISGDEGADGPYFGESA